MQRLFLATLLDLGTAALTSASSALAAQQAQLDCSGVERLTREQLTAGRIYQLGGDVTRRPIWAILDGT
jgi:hypothetical protein